MRNSMDRIVMSFCFSRYQRFELENDVSEEDNKIIVGFLLKTSYLEISNNKIVELFSNRRTLLTKPQPSLLVIKIRRYLENSVNTATLYLSQFLKYRKSKISLKCIPWKSNKKNVFQILHRFILSILQWLTYTLYYKFQLKYIKFG